MRTARIRSLIRPHLSHTLASTLRKVQRFIPAQLVPAEAFRRVLATASALPAALSSGIYMECRLAGDDERVDLVLNVDDRGRAIINGDNPFARLPGSTDSDPSWDAVRNLCTGWADPASPLAEHVRRIWLELDDGASEDGRPAIPAPGVFVKLAPERRATLQPATWSETAAAVLRPLYGGPLPDRVASTLERCFRELPGEAFVYYLGSFRSRGTDAVRLCVVDVTEDALPDYLRRIGYADWRGVGELVTQMHPSHGEPRPQLKLVQLEIGEEVGERIGLEYVLDRPAQMRGGVRERGFVEMLVARGLCTPARRDGLLAWPGYTFEELDHELWPSLVRRRVNHVKLVHRPGRPPEAKGYICLFHQFHRRAAPHTREVGDGRRTLVPA